MIKSELPHTPYLICYQRLHRVLYGSGLQLGVREDMLLGYLQLKEVLFCDKHLYYLKNADFCVVTPCGSCKNRRFGEM
jgi:hypothetical protein